MISEVTLALLAGLLSTIVAFVTALLARHYSAGEKEAKHDIDEIAKTVSARATGARARALEVVAAKLPEGLSVEEFEKAFVNQIRIGGDFVITQEPSEERELVEDLVNSYHHQALSQARVQFWFSVVAATVGFGYILFAAGQVDSASLAGYIKILPGAIIDVVAALFFRQAEKTRERATELYDRLRQDRQSLRAEAIVSSIEDMTIRSAVKAQIALHMAGLQPKEIDLPTFLNNPIIRKREAQPEDPGAKE